MKISIALCTHNGARYLAQQLGSIIAQDRLPDELIVCDDRSTDETAGIIANFAKDAPFSVFFSVNETTLGVTKNFERAITLCSGDIIFLCDQDDFWLPAKTAAIAREFEADENVGLVFSNAEVADSRLNLLGYTVWHAFGFDPKAVREFNAGGALDRLIRNYTVTGATAAFRASLRSDIVPIPSVFVHDAWIAVIAAACARAVAIDQSLILYRQHDSNVIGGKRKGLVEKMKVSRDTTPLQFDAEITRNRELLRKLRSLTNRDFARPIQDIDRKIRHLVARRKMYNCGFFARLFLVFEEARSRRYHEFSSGWFSAATDLCLRRQRS